MPRGTIDPLNDDPMHVFFRSREFTPFTLFFNIFGRPAISLPPCERRTPAPSVQLAGQPAAEGVLLALAAEVEAVSSFGKNSGRR
ncbi:MAG: amidase [Rhodococcus sp. (in: high G+C Gram-positive bacteria)]